MALLCTQKQETPIHTLNNHSHMLDWSDLPHDLILIIGDHLDTYTDYVRFRAVCVSYRNSLPKWPMHQYYHVPRLMLPYEIQDRVVRSFFDPLNQELVCHPDLPELTSRHCYCRGSSDGWLVTLDKSLTLKLFNPLTKSQIQLPPISTFPDFKCYDPNRCGGEFLFIHPTTADRYSLSQHHVHTAFIHKVVLSSSKNNFIAIAIHNRSSKLAFTKLGDHEWTPIPTSLDSFDDCIFFKEKIYALNNLGDLAVFPMDAPMQVEDVKIANMKSLNVRRRLYMSSLSNSKLYLVSRDDELLMVERLFEFKPIQIRARTRRIRKTIGFNLFKLEWAKKGATWSRINNLDDYTLFLGLNTSLCISSKQCPKLRGNKIYYTDDQVDIGIKCNSGGHDFGVFDISDRSCTNLLHNYDYPIDPFIGWPNPIWVVLNPSYFGKSLKVC